MSQNSKVIKLKNNSYKIGVGIESGCLILESTHEEITGQFEVELFQKNFGTFLEDTKDVYNIDCIDVKKNEQVKDFNKDFNFLERKLIKEYVLKCAFNLLNTHLNGHE